MVVHLYFVLFLLGGIVTMKKAVDCPGCPVIPVIFPGLSPQSPQPLRPPDESYHHNIPVVIDSITETRPKPSLRSMMRKIWQYS